MMDVQKMRDDYNHYKSEIAKIKKYDDARLIPVADWFGRRYAVIGAIMLTPDYQRLTVIDITGKNFGMFSNTWPEQGERQFVLLIEPDEGHTSIITESGNPQWISYAELLIRIQPGTTDDRRRLGEEMILELEQHVESGGGLCI